MISDARDHRSVRLEEILDRLLLLGDGLDPTDAREVVELVAADEVALEVARRWVATGLLPEGPRLGRWTPAMLMTLLRPAAALEAVVALGRDPGARLETRPGNPDRLASATVVRSPGPDRSAGLDRLRRWLEGLELPPRAVAAAVQLVSTEPQVLDLALSWIRTGVPPARPQVCGLSAADLAERWPPSAVLQLLVMGLRDPQDFRQTLMHARLEPGPATSAGP